MDSSDINCRSVPSFSLTLDRFDRFITLLPTDTTSVALSASYSTGRRLQSLVFFHDGFQAVKVDLNHDRSVSPQHTRVRDALQAVLRYLVDEYHVTYIAYDADILAAALFMDFGVRMPECFHVPTHDEKLASFGFTKDLLQNDPRKPFTSSDFRSFFDGNDTIHLLNRARGALAISQKHLRQISKLAPIDTMDLSEQSLRLTAKMVREFDILDRSKPQTQKHDIVSAAFNKNGDLEVIGARFKTRVRQHQGNQVLSSLFCYRMASQSSDTIDLDVKVSRFAINGVIHSGKTKEVKGKMSTFKVSSKAKSRSGAAIESLTTFGKEAPTTNETQIRNILYAILSGKSNALQTNPFLLSIYGLSGYSTRSSSIPTPLGVVSLGSRLNAAQLKAASDFCSATPETSPHIQLVHGPPGTGKTTLISSVVRWMSGPGSHGSAGGIYIVAQSNVAVKNVAEKLAKDGFLDFKLIVSEEFYYDWHEHLYEGVEDNIIRSSQLPDNVIDTATRFSRIRVVLCTLSMLANFRLASSGLVTSLLPPTTLIVDEASQISLLTYWPAFTRFENTLKKVCFVGDNKQLAPYGQQDVPSLQSIFERAGLVKRAYFLDTQYRMPSVIGDFISRKVYKGRLLSEHRITGPECLRFVDVPGTESKSGFSSQNEKEADCCVRIAAQLGVKDWRIITGYDAQRQMIENKLKIAKVPWEDKVFNVDSFQGNEANYIIVSLVRTNSPGFLRDKRRTNVMLSRCKVGMVIVANKRFLLNNTNAKETLVAQLVEGMEANQFIKDREVMNGRRVFK